MSDWHIYPLRDLIEHDPDNDDCICGPELKAEKLPDGTVEWIYVHHSLDGREQHERKGQR